MWAWRSIWPRRIGIVLTMVIPYARRRLEGGVDALL